MKPWKPPQGHLRELVEGAREDSLARQKARPHLRDELEEAPRKHRGFVRSLSEAHGTFPLICEMKRASPSAGTIHGAAHVVAQAQAYERGGAACISVLTEGRRFGGSLADLVQARAAVAVPLLRKDFIVDLNMVHEAAFFGADAILLIAGALPPSENAALAACAQALGLDVLLEVVQESELETLEHVHTPLVGINARDLETLEVDPERFARVAKQIAQSGRLLVAESGVKTPDDIRRLHVLGAGAALVGESLMRNGDPEAQVRLLSRAVIKGAA